MVDIETLIREVHARRSIWDQKHPTHHNRKAVHKFWKEIASNCDTTPHAARKKWKSLRDCFRTEYKKQIKAKSCGDGSILPSTWMWYKDLLFLKGQIGTKRKVHNIPPAIPEVENDTVETKCDIHYEDLKLEVLDPTEEAITASDQHFEAKTTKDMDAVNQIAIQRNGERTSPILLANSADLSVPTSKEISRKYPRRPEIPLGSFNLRDFHLNAIREDDTYYFLMSLYRPLNSLPAERAMFIRCKIQELIYNEISRIKQ